jgi:putative transcriptional regulator
MDASTSLANHFLIAMPELASSFFSQTVSYICEHNDDGAMGFVINRPMGITIVELFDQINIAHLPSFPNSEQLVLSGGPVEPERGFVLHTGSPSWGASMPVTPELSVTTSFDILEAIGNNEGPDLFLLALGYAGWGAGQLESEILENSWLSSPADQQLLFSKDCDDCWQQAASLIGIDLHQLHTQAGHA